MDALVYFQVERTIAVVHSTPGLAAGAGAGHLQPSAVRILASPAAAAATVVVVVLVAMTTCCRNRRPETPDVAASPATMHASR